MNAPDLFRPDAHCPRCGRGARLGFPKWAVDRLADADPNALVATYQCAFEERPGRKCNRIFAITARSLQRATLFGG